MSPMVGRAAQLEMLDRALARVAGRAVVVVEISGEPGSGKTRLLAELGLRAAATGLPTAAGFAEVLGGLAQTDLARSLNGHSGAGPPEDRFRLCAAVRRRLESVHPQGVALLLDDMHLADRLSLELAEFLIGTPSPVPILLAVAFRSGRPPTTLARAIAGLGPAVTRIALPGLSAADLEALLPQMRRRRRHLVMRASGGNPRYVQALSRLGEDALATLVDESRWADRCWLDGPGRDVLAATAVEIAAAGPMVLTVACAVAALGEQATFDGAAFVAGLPSGTVLPVVDQLYGLGLLDFDASRLRFRHPLVRAAVRGLVGPAWWISARVRATAQILKYRSSQPHAAALAATPWATRSATRAAPRSAARSAARGRPRSGAAPAPVTDALTPREREVADLVVRGLTNQQIAVRLFVSRRTVECHLSRVFAKLHVHSRTAMVHRLGPKDPS